MLNQKFQEEEYGFLTHLIDIKFEKFFDLIFFKENIENWDTAKDEIFLIKNELSKRIPNFYIFVDVLNRRIIKVGYKYKIFKKDKISTILVDYFDDERNDMARKMAFESTNEAVEGAILLTAIHFFREIEDKSIDNDGINGITIGKLGIQVNQLPSFEMLINACEEFEENINLNLLQKQIKDIQIITMKNNEKSKWYY